MYRLAVCEDEPFLSNQLCSLCRDVLEKLHVEHEIIPFSSAEALDAALVSGQTQFDVLLLDILLNGKTGMELARELRSRDDRVSIIFTTSCMEYLQQGYEVQPIQFLLKPVSRDALLGALKTDLRLNHDSKTLLLHMGARTAAFSVASIRYIESFDHSLVVHTTEGDRTLPLLLKNMEQQLPPDRFCRCHNSFIVNLEHIAEISHGEVTLRSGERLTIGRKYYADTQRAFIRYINP
jgi:DNA-binding LytR/AlgR family response regulator